MMDKNKIMANESGFVLVTALLILLILLVIGIAATTTSTIDIQIAANEKMRQQAFYQADGGAELASRVTYENALCINMGGFLANPAGINGGRAIGQVEVLDLTFANPAGGAVPLPSDAVRDVVFYPGNASDNDPHTNMTVGGVTVSSSGSGLAQVSAYEGLGQASAAGGTHVLYTINSQHRGAVNSESVIGLGWRLSSHLINNASSADCNFD